MAPSHFKTSLKTLSVEKCHWSRLGAMVLQLFPKSIKNQLKSDMVEKVRFACKLVSLHESHVWKKIAPINGNEAKSYVHVKIVEISKDQ